MWMEVHLHSVKGKSQAGNIWVKKIYWQHKKRSKLQDTQLGILKFKHFVGKFSRGTRIQETALLALRSICLWKYTHKLIGPKKGAVGA